MKVAAVVLAAGASHRLGRPKQWLVLDEETLVARAIRVARDAGLGPVFVVLREADAARRVDGAEVVVNAEAEEGMAASIRAGIDRARLEDLSGAVVIACDQVTLDARHLRALIEDATRMTGSRYAGRVGIPAYFPVKYFDALMDLQGDVGARELLHHSFAVTQEALVLDIDTEEDALQARVEPAEVNSCRKEVRGS